jgi:hypothetical protein
MTIDRLKLLMSPPAEPLYPGSKKDWTAFQKSIGLTFPTDYFTVAHTYGSGRFLAGELKIANPFDPDDEGFAAFELKTLRENKESSPDSIRFPLFPEKGGLYPFGIDGNGNTFAWITADKSSHWSIACFNPSQDYSEVVNVSLIDFLIEMASNQLNINRRKFWGNDVSKDMLEFCPRQLPSRGGRKAKRKKKGSG